MKKQDLLRIIDNELLEELFGFCYTRTKDSYEAEELCSDIVFALIKAACSNGEIENLYPFIWKVARNVYADFRIGEENIRICFTRVILKRYSRLLPMKRITIKVKNCLMRCIVRLRF